MFPTESQIAEVKAKHPGPLHLLEYDDGASAVIAKQPPLAEWNRLQSTVAADRGSAPRAVETFARACIVWPSPTELDAVVSERPALLARFGESLTEIAGAEAKVRAKKL